MNGGI